MNEEKRKLDGMESSSRRERLTTCLDMTDAHKSNLSHDVVCKS